MPVAEVKTLYPTNYRDAVATLRVIAQEIEDGKFGAVGCVAVVILGDQLSVMGMGPESEGPAVHYVLCSGAAQMLQPALEHGR